MKNKIKNVQPSITVIDTVWGLKDGYNEISLNVGC